MINRLPATATSFIGRAAELVQIEQLLTDPASRLLTLIGPGGIGKTRLALEAAQRLNFPHGVHFVPFQPLTSPDFMVSAIADSIGFHFYAGADPNQQLLDYLREKSLLLVLDNLEHLLDGVMLLSEILTAATGVRILATSRERLNLSEEWVLELSGLYYPTTETETDIASYNAVDLFVQRARRVNINFMLTQEHKPAIIRVCRLVGGMPLGIELAAAWVRALSCEQIASEIERSLDILETSARNVEPRHSTMRATLDQSWRLLSDSEREVFKKLSVFRGGFKREVAEYVAGSSLRTLTALVDKSLLRIRANGRYDILELLRQYGEEQLNQSAQEREHVHALHCAYFAEFLHQHYKVLVSQQRLSGLDAIQHEIDNIYAALSYMVKKRRVADISKSLSSLYHFFVDRPRPREAVSFYGKVVAALRSAASDRETATVFGKALAIQGFFYHHIGAPDKGLPLVEESIRVLRPLDSVEDMLWALSSLVMLTRPLNQLTETRQAAEEGLRLAREMNASAWIADFLILLANCLMAQGEYTEARQLGEEALRLVEKNNFVTLIPKLCSWILGPVTYEMADYEEAKGYFDQGLKISEELDIEWGVAISHKGLGDVALMRKDFVKAGQHYAQQIRIFFERNDKEVDIVSSLFSVVKLLRVQNESGLAVEILTLIAQKLVAFPLIQERAKAQLAQLDAELPPEIYAAAVEQGRVRELARTVEEVIVLLDHSAERIAAQPSLSPSPSPIDPFTKRELEILHLIADGFSNREIAEQLVLAVSTIKWYVNNIFSKLHVTTRTQALAHARTLGLLS